MEQPNMQLRTDVSATAAPTSLATISIPDLPEDVFLLLLRSLSAWDVVCCQRVSRSWRIAFSKEEYLRFVLQSYRRAREVRSLPLATLSFQSSRFSPEISAVNWKSVFLSVALRYHNLAHGQARIVDRHPMAPLEQLGDYFPVGQWDYHESQPGGRLYYETAAMHLKIGAKPYLFRSTLWSYDDGLVVYAPAICEEHGHFPQILGLLDVETGLKYPVPFNARGKIIRNLRLKERTLIVEWAEKDPFHNLNAMEQVNRHFANCFDVRPDRDKPGWTVTYRSEWKMHFLGLPPNHHDRFFSTHTATHYAVYFWQPNRSMYTGDEELPIESLSVWDISTPSPYMPSTDPSGRHRPRATSTEANTSTTTATTPNDPPKPTGPYILSRFSFTDLDFYGIRQRATVSLMSLHLDPATSSLTFRENINVSGIQGYFDPAERLWCAKTTTFPYLGQGPRWYKEWDGSLPPYRGHVSMESDDLEEGFWGGGGGGNGAGRDESNKWFLPVMDVFDREAKVRWSLVETCFSGHSVENGLVVRVKVEERRERRRRKRGDREEEECDEVEDDEDEDAWATLGDKLTKEVSGMGRIAGDERWLIGQNERMELVVVKF